MSKLESFNLAKFVTIRGAGRLYFEALKPETVKQLKTPQ